MDDRLTRLEDRVSEISFSLEDLGRRLAALEGGAAVAPLGTRSPAARGEEPEAGWRWWAAPWSPSAGPISCGP